MRLPSAIPLTGILLSRAAGEEALNGIRLLPESAKTVWLFRLSENPLERRRLRAAPKKALEIEKGVVEKRFAICVLDLNGEMRHQRMPESRYDEMVNTDF